MSNVPAFKSTQLPGNIDPNELVKQFDSEYFSPRDKHKAKGYVGVYANNPEFLRLADYIEKLKPRNVLDLGGAYGFLTGFLEKRGIPCVCLDPSAFAYKSRVTNSYKRESVLDMSSIGNKEIDLAVSVEMLGHIPEMYTEQALREIARVSNRGVHWIEYKEVDDRCQTQDVTHVNSQKPYSWWVYKVNEICGPAHKVIHKEDEWYNVPLSIPTPGPKRGLNIGSFVAMVFNTATTGWLNIDTLDIGNYARQIGFNFRQLDAMKMDFTDASLDYIIHSHFLEHRTKNEAAAFLKDCRRIIKPDGVMRITVPDAELLFKKYQADELGYFDDISPECKGADTQLSKLAILLLANHQSIYDWDTLRTRLEEAGFKPTRCGFNQSTRPDLMNQVFDYHPDLSLFVDAVPVDIPKAKLKIALISTPFITSPPSTYGGLELVVANLAKGLSEMGHDVTLFAAKGSKPIGPYRVFETVDPLLNFGTDWGKVDWYQAEKTHYDSFSHLLKDFDVIHGHGWYGFEYLAKRADPSLHVLHTGHGHLNWKSKPVEKMNLIAISDYMVSEYAAQGLTAKTAYNGVDLTAYPFQKEKGDRLIYVGRFSSFKQPHVAIEVAKRLDMGLDLVGGAYEEPYFSQVVKPFCDGKQIILHMEATHEEKVSLLQNAKALLFPSNMKEPFGLVAAEANACGTPVIALRDGAIPEVVSEGITGYVCNTVDEMISRVGDVGKIQPETCRDRVKMLFSIEAMSKRYLELYSAPEW